jgi:hypothetical protein
MPKATLSRGLLAVAVVAVTSALTAQASAGTIVYSNNGPPGDLVTLSGSSTDLGSTGWSYNVRGGGEMGIRTNIARSGNGSAFLHLTGTGSAAAEMTYYTGDSMGSLDDLNVLTYDWYRSSTSGVNANIAPALGLYVDNGTKDGWLIYEPIYNETNPYTAPVDQWVTTDAYDSGGGQFWSTITGTWKRQSLSAWQTDLANYDVYAVTGFLGSGLAGEFTGAVDNIGWGFDGSDPVTYNFEVVPEPSSVVMGIIAGGLGLAAAARRRLRG